MTTDTNASSTPDEQGSLTSDAAGAATQAAHSEAPPTTFTQAQLDAVLKSRLAEQSKKLTDKHAADLTAKIDAAVAARDAQIETTVTERVTAKLQEQAVAHTRSALQAEYGLSDAQLARLSGDTPDALTADAAALFGAFKQPKQAPALKTGTGSDSAATLDISQMTPAQIREQAKTLFNQTFS